MYVIKKDGTNEEFNVQKIIVAVNKSAARILYKFTDEELKFLCEFAQSKAESLHKEGITIQEMHNIVEGALYEEPVNPLHRRQEQCEYGQRTRGDEAQPDF